MTSRKKRGGQGRAAHLLESDRKLGVVAQEELSATALLYQTDEPGFLEPEDGKEKTAFVTQEGLRPRVSLQAANKMFSLDLDKGPYRFAYTRSGRHLLLGGEAGDLASFDWQAGRLAAEIDLSMTDRQEKVHDVCFLQNETMLAVAQANYVYMYDGKGVELHRLKKHSRVRSIDFLPFHFLLTSLSEDGWIRWQDVSVGALAAEWRFPDGLGLPSNAFGQNPATAVMHCGHLNGVVSLWSPALNKPLVRMSCHKGPVRAVAVSAGGHAMATAGLDGVVRTWDLRNSYRSLHDYRSMRTASSLSFSQRDLLGVSFGAHVVVWKDVLATAQPRFPYMSHVTEGAVVKQIAFCPYEDVLGIGHSKGFSSILIPGSGEPNYDIYEVNPFAGRRQRQEREVHALLDKLPMDTVSLDGGRFIGRVARPVEEAIADDRRLQGTANGKESKVKEKRKARGRSTALKRYLKKRANVIDSYKAEAAERARTETAKRNLGQRNGDQTAGGLTALNRFVSRAI